MSLSSKPDEATGHLVIKLRWLCQLGGSERGQSSKIKVDGDTRRAERSRSDLGERERLHDFEADEAWLDFGAVSFWRWTRQGGPPTDA